MLVLVLILSPAVVLASSYLKRFSRSPVGLKVCLDNLVLDNYVVVLDDLDAL